MFCQGWSFVVRLKATFPFTTAQHCTCVFYCVYPYPRHEHILVDEMQLILYDVKPPSINQFKLSISHSDKILNIYVCFQLLYVVHRLYTKLSL